MVSTRRKRPRPDDAVDVVQHTRDENAAALDKLRELQEELAEIDTEMTRTISEIESQYYQKKQPVFARRNAIINSIPDFWCTVLSNHPELRRLLTEEDQKIMRYLDTLDVESLEYPRKGYCITFNFKVNPYFEDKKLSKTVEYIDEGDVITNGMTIKWKEGKAPANVTHDAIVRNKELLPPLDNFFDWFSFAAEDTMQFDQDLVGDLIKEDLWDNPIKYLNNEFDDEDTEDDDDDDE